MTTPISDDELRKTARNLQRLQSFFTQRTGWKTSPETEGALTDTYHLLIAITGDLHPLMQHNNLEVKETTTLDGEQQQPPGEFDKVRLQKFSAFLMQLGEWFAGHATAQIGQSARPVLLGIHDSLLKAKLGVEKIMKNSAPPPPPPPPPPPRKVLPGAMERLELEDTEMTPVLQSFKGQIELSYEAKEGIHKFLESNGIEFNAYKLNKFEQKVQQWVESTPQGHLLVIKISRLRDEPYPSYIMKERNVDG